MTKTVVVAKQKWIWKLIFRFFYYIWFLDSENLCFILILKDKITRF